MDDLDRAVIAFAMGRREEAAWWLKESESWPMLEARRRHCEAELAKPERTLKPSWSFDAELRSCHLSGRLEFNAELRELADAE